MFPIIKKSRFRSYYVTLRKKGICLLNGAIYGDELLIQRRQNVIARLLCSTTKQSTCGELWGEECQQYGLKFDSLSSTPPKNARVVICGGGIMGAAVAYQLADRGWGPHTVLIEKGRIGEGNPWHYSGLLGELKPSYSQVLLAQTSLELIKEFNRKGLPTGWKQTGSLNLARTRDRMTMFRRMKSQSVAWNVPCELVSPERCKELCPIIETEDLIGGLWIPNDGIGNPNAFCQSLVKESINKGVTVVEQCSVTKIVQEDWRVKAVETTNGTVECVYFVNCAGFWARQVGQLSEPYVKVPLHAAEHYYLHTKPIYELNSSIPVVRDLDGHIYFRENNGCLLAGGFENTAKPAYEDGDVPVSMTERELPSDWDHFHPLLDELLHRIPCLKDATLERLSNCPEAFSPDCKWIIGEAPEIQNYLVAAGMKTIGMSAAAGVGRAIADIITQGYSTVDLHELDISRFLGLHNNRKFLRDRVREVPGLHYDLNYPFHEFRTGRNLRMSPIFPALKEAGAVFSQVMGYERPAWFDKNDSVDEKGIPKFRIATTKGFGKPHWFDNVQSEYDACREKIGLSDYSTFTKIDMWSKRREVVDLLQELCSNDIDQPVGSIVHTGMHNRHGGYENDCSLARLSENHYMMIAPTVQQARCKAWIERHLPPGGRVSVSDVTSMYTAICVMGPFTRIMLSELTDTDLSPKNFPFFTCKELDVGLANGIRALNLTHTGELGYVLYIPNEFALHVYTKLMEAGQKYGIKHCGYYAMRTLRVEKFFAFWGQDLDTFTTPLECGRMWRVKFDKPVHFIGRDALLRQRDEGVRRMYIQLLINDHDPDIDLWSWGGEPIYRNGAYCGQTTTTAYGFTFKKQICLGFVKHLDNNGNPLPVTNDFVLNGDYEVEIAGIRYPAKANLHSPNLPTKYPDQEREAYKATRDKSDDSSLLALRKR
ncbi:pyruvate dehydrogenase phosphatase regulatory subunit, mitochondrial [Malaya genurostris]|uniref:pyruvate dehydrogenase phosphatase regulatory subunit, mitochondrial n=1 Tax=Malaya genurostris TaxID=325434 RepID=UPI0026F39C43|nr:pyruvate dehydrogenase phosphatase regulatory subunit, mitochondrial [Malaya genurostris]